MERDNTPFDVTSNHLSLASGMMLFEAIKWLRNLLALIGALTVMYLLTSQSSFQSSQELYVGNRPAKNLVDQGNITAPKGIVILPIDSQ
jgi:uncharacterized protein involved in exopolysaccharide biosynthesis